MLYTGFWISKELIPLLYNFKWDFRFMEIWYKLEGIPQIFKATFIAGSLYTVGYKNETHIALR